MKGAGKIILGISFLSTLLLLYVHEQVSLFRISYLMDSQSNSFAHKSEQYRQLKFEVDQLKAPRLLEERLKEESLDLTLPKEIRVVKVPETSPLAPALVSSVPSLPLNGNAFLNVLGQWMGVAQAKTDSE